MRTKMSRWFSFACLVLLVFGCSPATRQPNEAGAHYMLGVSFLGEQNPTSALREFLKAAEMAPDRADIQQGLAQAYHRKHAYEDAETHYRRALELAPDDPQIENNLAALYLDMHRWDDAIRYFRKASHNLLFATPEIALTGIGFAQFQKGNYVDAIGAYQEAIKANPRYAQGYFRLGQTYAAMDKTQLAVGEFQKALDLVPDYLPALYHLGLARMKLRQPQAARQCFEEVLDLAPDSEYGRMSRDYLKLLK